MSSDRPTLRLRLTAAAESKVRGGHPWIYEQAIRKANRRGEAGETAVIYDRRDRLLAVGLFDPHSPIRVRVLRRGQPLVFDHAWMRLNLRRCLEARDRLFDRRRTTGYRVIHGESDGWPALVLDRYADTWVLKLYSSIWWPHLEALKRALVAEIAPRRLVLRLSRHLQNETTAGPDRPGDGSVLHGDPVDEPALFLENGLTFEADVIRGQKTGFFLDQRDNRQRVESLAAGKEVLNAFSFSGGFSLYAARGGARAVTDLDISAHALESARRNVRWNRQLPQIADCRFEHRQGDVFRSLGDMDRTYGLIVLDPPSLARRKSERQGALDAYRRLVTAALPRLDDRGILFAASCSAQITAEELFRLVRQTCGASGRGFVEMETTGHAEDHPATFPEARYLKGIFLRLKPNPRLRPGRGSRRR